MSAEGILEEYPQLERVDIQACIAYGAMLSNERVVDLPLEDIGA